jgi:hypothetical protein
MEASSVKINRARCVADISQCISELIGMHITMEASSVKINRARCVADVFQLIYFMVMSMFYSVQVHYAPQKVYLPHTPACTYTSHAVITVLL